MQLINFNIKQEKPSQHQQLKRIRKNLNGDFLEIGGFLLPYPGKTVATNHRFAGLVKGRLYIYIYIFHLKITTMYINYVIAGQTLIFCCLNSLICVKKKESLIRLKHSRPTKSQSFTINYTLSVQSTILTSYLIVCVEQVL